jgi:hypothetical protein
VDDFFPEADDLPEGIGEQELRARLGGVGGERHQRVVRVIDERVASFLAYRY